MATSTRKARDYQEDLYEELGSDLFADQFDLQHYLRTLRKHKLAIIAFTALVTALAALYAFTATQEYNSTATLLIETQGSNVPNIGGLISVDTESQDYYTTQYEILRSRSVATRVLNSLGLWNHPELSPMARKASNGFVKSTEQLDLSVTLSIDQKHVLKSFVNRLSVKPIRKTKLVHISYLSSDPELAAEIANTVARQYIDSNLESKLDRTSSVTSVLTERLTLLKATLDESKDRLLQFKKDNGLVEVGGSVGRLNEQQLQLATAELAEAKSHLAEQESIYNEVRSLRGRTDLLESIPAIQSDPLVRRIKVEQGGVQRELDGLLNRYGDRHPRVIDAQSQLETLDASLNDHVNRVVGSIENDFQLARSSVNAIQEKLDASKLEFQTIDEKQIELDDLESEVGTNQSIYDAFYSQINQVKSAGGLESSNARISDLALASTSPVKPKKWLIIAIAAIASLLLAMLMAFLYEQLNDTVKSSRDVEEKLDQRMLGVLPLLRNGIVRNAHFPVNPGLLIKYTTKLTGKKKESVDKYLDAIETARTTISVTDDETKNIIMFTSSTPGEGKSSTALAMAYSLSKIERVLLVDCDLRKPTVALAVIAKASDRATHVGLSELITGSAVAKNCIIRGAFGQYLDVLPAGQLPAQPLELLSSQRFKKILESLSQHYDRVILDCAPIQNVSDAIVLSQVSDSVVYCVQAQKTSVDMVKDGLQRLSDVGAHIEGILVTQADVNKFAHYGNLAYYNVGYTSYNSGESQDKGGQNGLRGKLKLSPAKLRAIQNDDSDVDLGIGDSLRNQTARNDVQHNQSHDQFDGDVNKGSTG